MTLSHVQNTLLIPTVEYRSVLIVCTFSVRSVDGVYSLKCINDIECKYLLKLKKKIKAFSLIWSCRKKIIAPVGIVLFFVL